MFWAGVELDGGQANGAVFRDQPRGIRRGDIGDEAKSLDTGEHPDDRRLDLWARQRAVLGLHDDLVAVAGLGGEVGLDDVLGLTRVGGRKRKLLA